MESLAGPLGSANSEKGYYIFDMDNRRSADEKCIIGRDEKGIITRDEKGIITTGGITAGMVEWMVRGERM